MIESGSLLQFSCCVEIMGIIQMKKQSGFTLIELMIVVAIIGILAAIALPAYRTYVIKSKMAEPILLSSQCRTSIAEIYQSTTNKIADFTNNWGCDEGGGQTQYVESVATDINGVITIAIANIHGDVDPHTITLTPQVLVGGSQTEATRTHFGNQLHSFKCEAPGVDAKYLPGTCRG